MNKAGGLLDQIQLSPAGMAALSAGFPAAGKSSSIAQDPRRMDLPAATSPQRKLSGQSEKHKSIPSFYLPMVDVIINFYFVFWWCFRWINGNNAQ